MIKWPGFSKILKKYGKRKVEFKDEIIMDVHNAVTGGAGVLSTQENELIKKCQQGDVEAFEKLISSYQKKVFTIAYRYMGTKEEAEDLAQEAFIKVFRSIKTFRGEASFSTWLFHIVSNVCRDALRKNSRKMVESLDCAVTTEKGEMQREVPDWSLSPEPIFENKELAQFIQSLIDQLTPEYKTVIIMREIQDMSYEEIAAELNCSLGTVKSRLSRARKALRDKIEGNREQNSINLRLHQQKEGKQ